MKKYFPPSMLLLLLMSAGTVVNAAKFGVAATVGGEEISELKKKKTIDDYLQQKGTNVGSLRNPDRFKAIREQVLDVLIGQELLWQAAVKDNTIADDEEVDRAFKQYRAQFDSEISFDNKLQEGGYNQITFHENLKHQLSAQKWIQEFALKDVAVSDAEVHRFYLDNKQQFFEPEKIRARHILIKVEPGASDAARKAAFELLAGIRQEIGSGADFAALAKEKSQGPSATAGGDLGYFGRGQMVTPFENAAFALAPGEISGIVETRFGFHLILLVERKSPLQYEEKDQAENIRFYLLQQKHQRAVEDAVTRLKKGTLIETGALLWQSPLNPAT